MEGVLGNYCPRLSSGTPFFSALHGDLKALDKTLRQLEKLHLDAAHAKGIYREWFVRPRFPGHQQVKNEKGLSQGWKPSPLGAVAEFTMGQSPSSEYFNEAGNGLPFHQGVGSHGPRYPSHETFCSVSGRKAKPGDILFSVRAPVGRLNIADRELILGRGLAAIRHERGMSGYLLYLLKVTFASEDIIGNGSIFNSVGKVELARLGVFEPSLVLVEKFETIVLPIDMQIAELYQANASLQSTRDRAGHPLSAWDGAVKPQNDGGALVRAPIHQNPNQLAKMYAKLLVKHHKTIIKSTIYKLL